MAEDDVQALAERAGWTVNGTVAPYAPEPGNWSAAVRKAVYAGADARVAEGHSRGKLTGR